MKSETQRLFSHRPDIKYRNYIRTQHKAKRQEEKDMAYAIITMLTMVTTFLFAVVCIIF